MAVDAIGRVANEGLETQQSAVDIEDFLKIFLAQLNFQDPLEPVDNREFLAQLAQFASLETSNRSNENSEALLEVTAITQSVGLVGREVQIEGGEQGVAIGEVIAISIDQQGNPQLTIRTADGEPIIGVSPAQITLVR